MFLRSNLLGSPVPYHSVVEVNELKVNRIREVSQRRMGLGEDEMGGRKEGGGKATWWFQKEREM